MPLCACQFPGRLDTDAHRAHHRQWDRERSAAKLPVSAHVGHDTAVLITLDQLIAHAHGGPLPDMTPGAQAILARQALDDRGER